MSLATQNAANLLTLARLLCVPPIVVLTVQGEFRDAAAVFLLAAVTDIADGFVAKHISGPTELGAVLDPLADKVLMASVFVTLVVEGHLPPWLAVLVIGRDAMIVLGTVALRRSVGPFRVEPLLIGKAATFVQLMLGGAVLAKLSVLPELGPWLEPLVLGTAAVIVASALAYVHAAARIWALARVAR
jgi:cardiolipin synthase